MVFKPADKCAVVKAITSVKNKSQKSARDIKPSITINFHPDRLTYHGQPLLLALAKDGYLKSQFETQTSNGGLTAYKGGDRWRWEQEIFGGAYDEQANHLRPKYGALNFKQYEFGAAPRFGSAFFQLKPHVFERATFCYPDSFFEPKDFAVGDRLQTLVTLAESGEHDLLDDYIEAHVHGALSIKEDIECVVMDPIYHGGQVHEQASRLGIPVEWHQGFELSIQEMERFPDYRGQEFITLAKAIAVQGKINPKLLDAALASGNYDAQDIKKIWHYLARFGYPVPKG
ncbi:DUF3626 domain-containing protein [Vibrio sp. SCSIO 43136]|uniref:DUF3626 domain-containing protein n=1 Tax=Vibrio sp. SCSIO 43136 TaxID=2819101 RepID=UPI0020764ECD|nr:DUF3626 domain-containing protein [Vibrio sp. SCSIO 43136]USD68039.1 DUF3626 domain-containing protein [Vibrio sp. SCSIO 43136]